MNRKLLLVGAMCVALASLNAATEVVNGIRWTYTVSGSRASVGGDGASATAVPISTGGAITIPSSLGGYPVVSIGNNAFQSCYCIQSVVIGNGITNIGGSAFAFCSSLKNATICSGDIGTSSFYQCGLTNVTIGAGVTNIGGTAFDQCGDLMNVTIGTGVTNIGENAFRECNKLKSFVFQGDLPIGIASLLNTGAFRYGGSDPCHVKWPRVYSVNYIKAGYLKYFAGFTGEESMPAATVVSSAMRTNDPTVMDVAYNVISKKAIARVRALAFEDGERSFAKVVRPETFVNDTDGNPTAQNVGDNIAANVTNALSWKVSSDWATRLSKVKFEVLSCDGALLPMETTIIPASDRYGTVQISWNRHTVDQIFDALMWLYADRSEGLTLENGALKVGGKTLENGMSLSENTYRGLEFRAAAAEFVYRSMGFDGVLSGDLLNYVNEETRLGLEPYGIRQYAYKFIEE